MSLTFRQTRYQALYKDVQRLIEDTASIAVRRGLLVYVISLPHTAATGYEGKLLINISNLSQHHLNCQSNPLNHLLQRSAPYNT